MYSALLVLQLDMTSPTGLPEVMHHVLTALCFLSGRFGNQAAALLLGSLAFAKALN